MTKAKAREGGRTSLHDVVANLIVGTGQIASALGISRTTVIRMAREGRLSYAYRTDAGVFRFRIRDLVDYLDRETREREAGTDEE